MLLPQTNLRTADAGQIVDIAILRIAEDGLRKLTLRDVAQAVGKSTTVIVNLFGARSGLVQAAGEEAMHRDAAFHADFFGSIEGLKLDRDGLLSLSQTYLRLRSGPDASFARVWEALLLDPDTDDQRQDLMRRWEAMRHASWRTALASTPGLDGLAGPLLSCLTIEQFYAGALSSRVDYQMVAVEGLGSLIDHVMGRVDGPATATRWYGENLVLPKAPADGLEPDAMRRRLLDIAADQIMSGGLSAISNRSVSVVAGTSTSTIAYHWPDMRRFVLDAVWHSVFRDMPRYLARDHPRDDPATADLDSWALIMAPTVSIQPDSEGFYVKYARLIATICVEARRDPSLRDLAMLLRGPEGGGTFHNSAGVWPQSFDLTRLAATRFALWIKGSALAASATGTAITTADLKDAALLLVPSRR